ncbi:MAG: hypothetical protein PF570_02790 [Candidatus Cloacimonetes bacterium]|jgi:hypothetical protein|nr:hypothetical protein [Candidatus Cloacimonadota bacterium]
MSQVNEQEKKLKEPVPKSEIGFSITKVDKANGQVQVQIQIKSQALMDRLNELFGVDTSESTSNQADYSELTLSQKLDHLLELEIIRKKKYDNYFEKINDKTTAPGLLRYFEKQFDLLHRLYVLAGLNKMSDDTRATIYKRIMSSKMKDFTEIDNELKTMEAA